MEILLIEDNEELGSLIRDFLKKEGFEVCWEKSSEEGLNQLEMNYFKLVLLDVMLPGMDGFETCSIIRKTSNIPILMMSAKNDEGSKLMGYDCGADDYVDKPIAIPILVAKMKALIKRSQIASKEEKKSHQTLEGMGITLDLQARTVTKAGKLIAVNGKEFELLSELMRHKGEVIPKDKLFDAVWGADCFSEAATLNVHIRWLREKLEEDSKNPRIIQTVWGVGYKFGDSDSLTGRL